MIPKKIFLNGKNLSIQGVNSAVKDSKIQVKLDSSALKNTQTGYDFLTEALSQNNKVIYGINTGFGPMANYILAHGQLLDLQKNLILSHAVGFGEKISDDFIFAAMIIRLNTLARGFSGVSPELLDMLGAIINHRVIPIVPEHGAVGTSGDLVQLAHIALALLGQGQVTYKNKIQKSAAVLKQLRLRPYKLKPKEGLALINGTSVMTGVAALVCERSQNLLGLAVQNGCLALELVKAYDDSFSDELHALRPHPGQLAVAKTVKRLLKGSKLIRGRDSVNKNANHGNSVSQIKEAVQEVYSIRCLAQILGPAHETLAAAWQTVETEMNSVTDNPIVDWPHKKFLHGGNFHGDYIAVKMDQLKMSLTKMTMLSERRLNFFLNNKINQTFPPFLNLDTPGLTLGLQALQFVATSTTAQSQTLSYPMNLHSISSNADNQDVVSMGTDAALLTAKTAENAYIVLTIELFALCQAVDCLKIQNQLSAASLQLYKFVRQYVDKITDDRHIQPQLQILLEKVKSRSDFRIFGGF